MSTRGERNESGPDVSAFYQGIVEPYRDVDHKALYLVIGYMFGRRR